MKKKVFIYATCHASRMAEILKLSDAFNKNFSVNTQQNFISPGKPADILDYKSQVQECDFFLYHKTVETLRKLQLIQYTDKSMAIPYITNSLHWPSYDFKRGVDPLLTDQIYKWGLIPYRCAYLESLYCEGRSHKDTISKYLKSNLDDIYDLDFITKIQFNYFNSLDDVGKLNISGWLIDRLSEKRLFHIYNHPSSAVFLEIGRQVLAFMGLPDDLPEVEGVDRFDILQTPIHHSVARKLNLKFYDADAIYNVGPYKIKFEEYLKLYLTALSNESSSKLK